MLQAAVLSLLLCSAYSFTVTKYTFDKNEESSGNTIEDDDFSISTLLEKANKNLGKNPDDPVVVEGDIVVPYGLQNADPCTACGCLWPKARDGYVYVPYRISNQYSQEEKETIIKGLQSFAQSTCIRFTPRSTEEDFVDIEPLGGCYSSVGRTGGCQNVSLARPGCVSKGIIQHEMLHALGFNHEHTRSDRDEHVQIRLQNVKSGKEHNFRKIQTRNLGTRYDYGSVMHYASYAFSRNGEPTIVPIPDHNVCIGGATEMNPTDILRVNLLYKCGRELGNSTEGRK